MGNQQLMKKLKAEAKKLKKLDMQQKKADRIKAAAKKEELKIRKEIKELKARTNKSLFAKIKKKAITPEAKAKAKKSLKMAKKSFGKFQKFVENFGE